MSLFLPDRKPGLPEWLAMARLLKAKAESEQRLNQALFALK